DYEADRDLRTEVNNRLPGAGADRSRYVYIYDDLGRRTSRVQNGTAFISSSYDRFGYNDRSEVVETKRYTGTDPEDYATDPEATALRRLYSFDHLGNRLTSQEGSATARVYTSNSLNQYTQVSGFSFQPLFDADGNQTLSEDGWHYQWDAENRLVRARDFDVTPTSGSKVIDFVYDYQSRRVRKTVEEYDGSDWQVVNDRKFIYDDWNLIAEYGPVASSWQLAASYTWGLDLRNSLQGTGGVGGLLAVTIGADSFYATSDVNGNVSEYLNDTGAVEAHFEYDAFGRTVSTSGTDLERFVYRFSTKYEDAGTGLYYYGFRYCNPSTGRWLNRDPLEEYGGVNIYALSANNLTNLVDYLGMKSMGRVNEEIANQFGNLGNIEPKATDEHDTSGKVAYRFTEHGSIDWSGSSDANMPSPHAPFQCNEANLGSAFLMSQRFKGAARITKSPHESDGRLGEDRWFEYNSILTAPATHGTVRVSVIKVRDVLYYKLRCECDKYGVYGFVKEGEETYPLVLRNGTVRRYWVQTGLRANK